MKIKKWIISAASSLYGYAWAARILIENREISDVPWLQSKIGTGLSAVLILVVSTLLAFTAYEDYQKQTIDEDTLVHHLHFRGFMLGACLIFLLASSI